MSTSKISKVENYKVVYMSKASLLCKRIKKSLRLYGFHNLIMDVLTVFSACMSIFAAFSRNDIVLGLSCLLLFFLLIIVSISFYLYKKDSVKLDHLYIDNYVISPDGSYKIKKTPLIKYNYISDSYTP